MLEEKLNRLRKWFVEKTDLIEQYFNEKEKSKMLACRMGEIYFAKIGVNVGAEMDKHRPVLVCQGEDLYLKKSDMVFVFPITGNTEKKKYKVLFDQEDIQWGHVQKGGVLVQQFRSISKFRLERKIGKMKIEKMQEIQAMFKKCLYKNTPLQR